MGRAIVREPKVFLFDEPLSNLDAKLRTQMRFEIKRLHQRLKSTTVYVTHDQIEAMTLADRIVVMHEGRIQQVGSPRELYERPANTFVAQFIGNPPMNLLTMQVAPGAAGLVMRHPESDLSFRAPAGLQAGQEVIVGIRPSDLALPKPGSHSGVLVKGRILLSELLGSETLLEVDANGLTLVAQVPGRDMPRQGEEIAFEISHQALHVFDPRTQMRLG